MPPPEQLSSESSHTEPERSDRTVDCAACGTFAAGPPITWMFDTDGRRGVLWYCDRCARENLRSVEAKLDRQWW